MNLATMPLSHALARGYAFTSPGESRDSQVIRQQWIQVREHYAYPVTRQSVEQTFRELVETWKTDRGSSSSMTELLMHPAYQRIIGMGPAIVSLILAELERQPDHWFWALYAITGANPVRQEDAGHLKQMTRAWIRWGEEQGYIWRVLPKK